MSATLQEGELAAYYNCPVVKVSGRTFPVQEYFMADILERFRHSQSQNDSSPLNCDVFKESKHKGVTSRRVAREAINGLGKLIQEFEGLQSPTIISSSQSNSLDNSVAKFINDDTIYTDENFHKHPEYWYLIAAFIHMLITSPVPPSDSSGRGNSILVFLSGSQFHFEYLSLKIN